MSIMHITQPWRVMIAAYLAGIAVALNQFKVPPVMPILIATLDVDMATGGWLMSSFAVAGVILGLPAAFVLAKLGPRPAGLIALGCTIIGSSLGALAQGPAILLLSRAIEGIGLGLITVVAPAVVSMWFSPEERGTPMGIWASWVPAGVFLMFNLAGPLLGSFGWRGIWWFGALFALAVFILYATVVRAPAVVHAAQGVVKPNLRFDKALLNPSAWILAVIFAAFSFSFMAYGTWAPSYLNSALKMNLAAASSASSASVLANIPSNIIAGRILDRMRNRSTVLIAAFVIAGILLLWSFRLSSVAIVVPYMVALGFVAGFIPTTVFTLAPQTVVQPELAGVALGIISVGQSVGQLLGPPVAASAIGDGNWEAGVLPVVGSIVIGLAASVLLYRKTQKKPRMTRIPRITI